MAASTNVPFPTFGPSGFIAPAESAVLAGAQADINGAFGGVLNQNLTTPQGQIATSETAIIGENNAMFLQYIAGVDPATSSGKMQDGIARIYFLTRDPAEPSVVTATVSGQGATIPVGALITDGLGNIYNCTNAVTLPAGGGSLTTTFQNNVTGPIAWQSGAAAISKSVNGWDSVTINSGVLGQNVETAQAFELRRQQSVAMNAVGSIPAIQGAVLSVAGVTDCYVTDNYTSTPTTVGGITIGANALYVCVVGGLTSAVAMAIWTKKQPGCGYYSGNTTVTVTDPSPSYSTPPSYPITFETAINTPIYVAVTLGNSTAVPATALASIQTAIANAFAGLDGGAPVRIGAAVLASRFYAGIAALGAWAQIVSIFVGTAASPTATFVQTSINQKPTVAAANITLALATV